MADETDIPDHDATRPDPISPPARKLQAQELFAGSSEVWIEHEGERYRLRITRRGKLILQK